MNILDSIERKIQRGARARPARFQVAIMRLDTANARSLCRRLDHHVLAAAQCSSAQSARDYRSDTLQFKYTVNGQARLADIRRRWCVSENLRESSFHVVNSPSGDNGCGDDRRVRKRRVLQFFTYSGHGVLFVLR